ncbi:2-oxoacid:acceptor oxidoreductase subunit alpha [Acidaminobacter sp. JC074]|uniref:2-oxoacid:acceptor oxidoreductase subunit alpha n=1 Tax=Acidaminobacter sp. JC074 TaxID=2530199 RepID=UPI001F106D13|nr:2-oxoacid:acceptor oxidoreductase subunit alpha [Acidaminobacter sp. JC074]MCH4890085.1 2-oxoacid:acceptor oxidoreductase subunit alpha [Acidaminobacter sp. JC074]
MKYNIVVGGAAGQGVKTLAKLIGKTLKHHGFYTFTNTIYMSRIRGGHNFFQIRFSDQPLYCHEKEADLLIALNDETYTLHKDDLKAGSFALLDASSKLGEENIIKINAKSYEKDVNVKKSSTYVTLGAIAKLFNLDKNISTRDLNTDQSKAFGAGYDDQKVLYSTLPPSKDKSISINGNEATALGAIAAGMDFFSAYPMTPATSVMTYLSDKQDQCGYIVEQAEDEIAAMNMATGASYAGARTFVATSGGGFALMTEALGMSAIAELPIVVLNVQRPGPATGMPTKTSQSDLSFILHSSPDEYPRMIISLTDASNAFYQTFRAFNIADKYQMPVILLSDRYLADARVTISPYDLNGLVIDRSLADENMTSFKRHEITESGISPRLLPGNPNHTVFADSHEHDESVNIVEDADMRVKMHDKRLRKLETLKSELIDPDYYGNEDAKTVLVGWGSSSGLLKEVTQDLDLGALVFGDIYPLPSERISQLKAKGVKFISVEHNATGQFAKYLRGETGITMDHQLLKYDGRQFDIKELKSKVLEVM